MRNKRKLSLLNFFVQKSKTEHKKKIVAIIMKLARKLDMVKENMFLATL